MRLAMKALQGEREPQTEQVRGDRLAGDGSELSRKVIRGAVHEASDLAEPPAPSRFGPDERPDLLDAIPLEPTHGPARRGGPEVVADPIQEQQRELLRLERLGAIRTQARPERADPQLHARSHQAPVAGFGAERILGDLGREDQDRRAVSAVHGVSDAVLVARRQDDHRRDVGDDGVATVMHGEDPARRKHDLRHLRVFLASRPARR